MVRSARCFTEAATKKFLQDRRETRDQLKLTIRICTLHVEIKYMIVRRRRGMRFIFYSQLS